MASWPWTQTTRRQGDNEDCRTPGVVNTGKVDVMKIWNKLPQWLPWTSLTNFQIMAQTCWVGCSVKHQQHAKLCYTSHKNKCNTGTVSSWATCSSDCFMSKPDSWFTIEQIIENLPQLLGFLDHAYPLYICVYISVCVCCVVCVCVCVFVCVCVSPKCTYHGFIFWLECFKIIHDMK